MNAILPCDFPDGVVCDLLFQCHPKNRDRLARYLLLCEFEVPLILAKNHSDFAGSFVLTILRGQTSKITLTFYCDPRVQPLFKQQGIPAVDGRKSR